MPQRANRGAVMLAGHAKVLELAPEKASALVLAVTSELKRAGRLNSSLGQQAILLSARIGAPYYTGSATAVLSKELRATMEIALQDPQAAPTRSSNCGFGDCASLA
jgi:hypothetical protein